jgi:hypothetical protein
MSLLFSFPSPSSLPKCECPAESLIKCQPPCELLWSQKVCPRSCPSLLSHGGADVPRTPSWGFAWIVTKSDLPAFVVTCAPNSSVLDVS